MYKIYDLFKYKTEQIQFTGGEPFLNPDGLKYLVDSIINHKIKNLTQFKRICVRKVLEIGVFL